MLFVNYEINIKLLLQALSCHHPTVIFEVVLGMESLVTRLGETLQYTIWEHVLKILDRTAEYVSKCFNTIIFF